MFFQVHNASMRTFSRRTFLKAASMLTTGIVATSGWPLRSPSADPGSQFLEEFGYGDVLLASDLHNRQLEETSTVLMGLS